MSHYHSTRPENKKTEEDTKMNYAAALEKQQYLAAAMHSHTKNSKSANNSPDQHYDSLVSHYHSMAAAGQHYSQYSASTVAPSGHPSRKESHALSDTLSANNFSSSSLRSNPAIKANGTTNFFGANSPISHPHDVFSQHHERSAPSQAPKKAASFYEHATLTSSRKAAAIHDSIIDESSSNSFPEEWWAKEASASKSTTASTSHEAMSHHGAAYNEYMAVWEKAAREHQHRLHAENYAHAVQKMQQEKYIREYQKAALAHAQKEYYTKAMAQAEAQKHQQRGKMYSRNNSAEDEIAMQRHAMMNGNSNSSAHFGTATAQFGTGSAGIKGRGKTSSNGTNSGSMGRKGSSHYSFEGCNGLNHMHMHASGKGMTNSQGFKHPMHGQKGAHGRSNKNNYNNVAFSHMISSTGSTGSNGKSRNAVQHAKDRTYSNMSEEWGNEGNEDYSPNSNSNSYNNRWNSDNRNGNDLTGKHSNNSLNQGSNSNKKKKDPAAKAQKNFQRLLAKQQKSNTYTVVDFFAENEPQPPLDIKVPERDEFLDALLEPPTPLNQSERPRQQLSIFFDVAGLFVNDNASEGLNNGSSNSSNGSPRSNNANNAHLKTKKELKSKDDLNEEQKSLNSHTENKWARVRDYLEDVSDSNNSTVRECFERLRRFAITDEEKAQIEKESSVHDVPTLVLNVDLSDAYKRMALCVKMLHALCGKEPRVLATFRMRPPPITELFSESENSGEENIPTIADMATTAKFVDGLENLPMRVREEKRLEQDSDYDVEGNRVVSDEVRDTVFYESLAEMLELETPGFFSLPGDPEEKRRLKEERAQLRRELKHKQNVARREREQAGNLEGRDTNDSSNNAYEKSLSASTENSGVLVDLLKSAFGGQRETNDVSTLRDLDNFVSPMNNKKRESIYSARENRSPKNVTEAKAAFPAHFPERSMHEPKTSSSSSDSISSIPPPPGLGFNDTYVVNNKGDSSIGSPGNTIGETISTRPNSGADKDNLSSGVENGSVTEEENVFQRLPAEQYPAQFQDIIKKHLATEN